MLDPDHPGHHHHHHHHHDHHDHDPQPILHRAHHPRDRVEMTEDGLVVPKKLFNPCLESKEVQDLNREIKWNARIGINVLAKSELDRALERRKWHNEEVQRKFQADQGKSDFQKVLEERAKRIEDLEKCTKSSDPEDGDSGLSSPEPEPEFLRVHAQLRRAKTKI